MKRDTLINVVGVILVAGCFVVSAAKVLTRTIREERGDLITIRFCHWQLETGLREAFDAVAAEYSRLHPSVRVEQTAVPGAVYGTYVRTRLTGDNPPDLVQFGGAITDDLLSRHFSPLGSYVNQPNPYNKGTEFENTPWRETFIDGLGRSPGLETLQDYYAIPTTLTTTRMFCNIELYKKVMGHDRLPTNYEEFLELCSRTNEFAKKSGQMLVPVAGSRFNAQILLDELMRSQTQQLARKVDRLNDLRLPAHPAMPFLNGQITLASPELQSGMALMREVALQMQPGFLQFDRDEAMFYFAQQRAVMIATGSWDFQSIRQQSPFEIRIFKIPLPSPSHPVYGKQILGARSELADGIAGGLFLSQRCPHPEIAVDFLRFLTSKRGHQLFVSTSRWLPSVRGVVPEPETQEFTPEINGMPPGFSLAPIMWGSGEMFRVQSNHLHLLFSQNGSVEQFVKAMANDMDNAVRRDATELKNNYVENVRRMDVSILAAEINESSDDLNVRRRSGFIESQTRQEADYFWLQNRLTATPSAP
jgi:raffinose/stachyose/melibiose transport system substrate-binding protein